MGFVQVKCTLADLACSDFEWAVLILAQPTSSFIEKNYEMKLLRRIQRKILVINLLVLAAESITIRQCNSGGRGIDEATSDIKYLGTFGWPVPIDEAFECEWSIDLANGEEGKFLKISFIDYKHNCKSGKRNRLWLKENGIQKLMRFCGKIEIPDYIAKSGSVTIGANFEPNVQALISYQAVLPKEEMNVPDEIAELKAAAAAERTYIKSRAYEETIYGESSYDYNYQSPALKSRVRGGGIQYSEPKRAIIKIAQAPPTPIYIESPRKRPNIHHQKKSIEKLGLRNVLLTCIFGALGVIFLCGVIYLVRRYVMKMRRDEKALTDAKNQIAMEEERILQETKTKYENQSTKLKPTYKNR